MTANYLISVYNSISYDANKNNVNLIPHSDGYITENGEQNRSQVLTEVSTVFVNKVVSISQLSA